jgi:acetylornithine deacetylase/succinyl-diaminopimelate desuccinylase family protein
MPLDLVKTLADLVALPSVNPMGRDLSGPQYLEHQVTDYLERLFRQLKVPFARQWVAPLRENIIARIDGTTSLVMFEAHQDTVPVDGMTIPPWDPQVRNGRLYGRGACDIKGGMAAMLTAFARLADEQPPGMPTLLMVCTVNEEFGFTGARALPHLWERGSSIIPRRPDIAIIAEPTEMNIVVAHKGVVRWRCHAHGRAAHSSQPQLGDSAVFRMARVLEALEIYQHDVVAKLADHALCGRPTISVGTISGGLSVNTVPDQCTIEIDRRCVPGEKPSEAYQHVLNYLRGCLGDDPLVQHDVPFSESLGLNDANNRQLAERLQRVACDVAGRSEIAGVPYGTNAATIADAGIPAVVFGPGSIAQAHTADEWIALDQLEQASDVYFCFASEST